MTNAPVSADWRLSRFIAINEINTMPFQPGQSGNPSGRPRGAAGLARYLRQRLGENAHAVMESLIAIATDPNARDRDRIAASSIILDRMYGRAHQSSSVAVAATSIVLPAGWSAMSGAERLAWADSLRQRALAGGAGLLGPGEDDG